ncbi:unnamed protein product, partial [marine sediment metagenome]
FILESITENGAMKKDLFTQVELLAPDGVIVASNTCQEEGTFTVFHKLSCIFIHVTDYAEFEYTSLNGVNAVEG